MTDKVNHPSHYNSHPSGIECITIIEHMPHNIGAAVKYLWRAGLKENSPTLEDYDKAIWYIEREKQRLGLEVKEESKICLHTSKIYNSKDKTYKCNDCGSVGTILIGSYRYGTI